MFYGIRICFLIASAFVIQALGQPVETKIKGESVQEFPTARVGVINLEQVLRSSLVWKDLQKWVEQRRVQVQQDIAKEQQILEKEGQQLKARQQTLSQEVFAQERDIYFTKVQAFQQRTQEAKTSLDNYYLMGRDQVYEALNGILVEISQQYGLSLIIDQSSRKGILYVDERILLDDRVLQALNERIVAIENRE